MRRSILLITAAGFAVVAAASPTHASRTWSQAESARHVAARVQSFYERVHSVHARFYQTYHHRLYDRYERSYGTIQLQRPGRIRFDYTAPQRKLIVSDGEVLTWYRPSDRAGAGQYAQMDASRAALADALSFLVGDTRLDDRYAFRIRDGARWAFRGHLLELTPLQRHGHIRKMYLYVDSRSGREGIVHAVRIDDHRGNRNKFVLRNMKLNRPLSSGTFRWTPPANAHRMRM